MNSTTYKNRLSRIPRMLDSGANILEIHPEDSMEIIPTHKPLQASTATGAIMESTAEARLTLRQVEECTTRNVPRTRSLVPSKTHHSGPGSFMRSRMCGGTNRLKGLCITQKQAFINRSEKKGTNMVSKPDGLRRQPYSK